MYSTVSKSIGVTDIVERLFQMYERLEIEISHGNKQRSSGCRMADDHHVLVDHLSTPVDNDPHTLRKRKRQDTDELEMSQPNIHRDPSYYFEDGSCILLVQDTLFNVHRSLLSRDNSSFSSLFTLPQGSQPVEGQSDDNPIILRGDTPSEFRHFLWALYALPPELQIVNSSNADLNLLIDIVKISHKYSYRSIETWALDAVQEYINRRPSHNSSFSSSSAAPSSSSSSSSFFAASNGGEALSSTPTQSHLALIENTEQLTRLIQLAQLCNHERLLNSMIALLRQLMSRSLHYAYLSMTLADDLNLRSLRGAAYLEVMQRGSFIGAGKRAKEEDGGEPPSITPAQQVRLLSGYWHLTRTWERLRSTPPTFGHAPSCSATWHQPGCNQAFIEFWKEKTQGEAVISLGLADVIGRLRQVQKDYDRSGPTYMAHECKLNARRSLIECIKNVEEKLPDYFSGEGLEDDF
ncbi:hypothetical protein GYMLUDRAFT_34183 [Collybiopsis luxurians FD-317 M1]|nr:hypothetical protein GYMLUDRAFT_34183 [Collybiopsis luxurians FD-317 M1]